MPRYRYTLLAPMRDVYIDNEERDLLTVQSAVPGAGQLKVTLVGRASAPEMIRSEFLGVEQDWSADQLWAEREHVEHLISMLRLTTDHPVERLMLGQQLHWVDTEGDAQGKPRITLSMTSISTSDYRAELKSAGLLFEKTLGHRQIFKLLGDAQLPNLPLSYRYLSIYRILELEFKVGHKWPQLDSVLEPFENEYRSLNVSNQSFENCMHAFRDMCAHIKSGKSDEVRGIIGLDKEEYPRVEKLFALLKTAVLQHLTTKFPITFTRAPTTQDGLSKAPSAQKAQLDEIYKSEKAADLERTAIYWEREAHVKPDEVAIAAAAKEFARHARFLAGLLNVRSTL